MGLGLPSTKPQEFRLPAAQAQGLCASWEELCWLLLPGISRGEARGVGLLVNNKARTEVIPLHLGGRELRTFSVCQLAVWAIIFLIRLTERRLAPAAWLNGTLLLACSSPYWAGSSSRETYWAPRCHRYQSSLSCSSAKVLHFKQSLSDLLAPGLSRPPWTGCHPWPSAGLARWGQNLRSPSLSVSSLSREGCGWLASG